MPDIAITAAITDGTALLFEELNSGRLRLPTLPFTNEYDEIEAALAAHLLERLGVEIVEQQFVDTVFERQPSGAVTVNNVQIVTTWTGDMPQRDVVGVALRWVPLADVPRVEMSDDLRQTLIAALGVAATPEVGGDEDEGEPGRVVVLTGADEESVRVVAQHFPATLGRCALIDIAAIRGVVRPGQRDTQNAEHFPALMRRVRLLGLQNTAALALNTAAAGFDTIIYGTFHETQELDALLTGLLGSSLHVVQLVREGRRPDPRGLQITQAPGGAAETAARIVERLDSARVA
jgi:hypothetical protein